MRTQSVLFLFFMALCSCKSSSTTTSSVDVAIPHNAAASDAPREKVRSITVGDPQNNSAVALILGSDIGGAEGTYISKQMDIQATELGNTDVKSMKILRIGEGIKVTCDGNVMFSKNSSALTETSKKDLDNLAGLLTKYNNTKLVVEGHTDGSGPATHNHVLSEQRAKAVAAYLASHNISSQRIKVIGRGESQPLFANNTEDGRRQNRRVEIVILADESLKKEARANSGSN